MLRELLPGLQIDINEECEKLSTVKKLQLQQDLLSAVLCDVSANKPVMCLLDTCHTLNDTSWQLLKTVRRWVLQIPAQAMRSNNDNNTQTTA